jgi:ribose transport system substrate-binding protein
MEEVVPNVDYNLGVDYDRAGRLLADWVISKDTSAHVLVLVSDEIASAAAAKKGISAEFDQHGGGGIKYSFVNVPIAEWEKGTGPAVKAALAADAKLSYIICIYDSMSQFVAPAIAEAKAGGNVRLIGFNGSPLALDLIREGKMEMDLGESLAWAGYAIADAEMRILDGNGAVKSMNIPFRIFTKENVAEAGVPASFDKGYGDTFKAEYAKLWKL